MNTPKIIKSKRIKVAVGTMKPQNYDVQLIKHPNGTYEVRSGIAFCHITGNKSPQAIRNGMNLPFKYFNEKKLAERFFNIITTKIKKGT